MELCLGIFTYLNLYLHFGLAVQLRFHYNYVNEIIYTYTCKYYSGGGRGTKVKWAKNFIGSASKM